MNYTIEQLLNLGEFLLLPSRGYTKYANKLCTVIIDDSDGICKMKCSEHPGSSYHTDKYLNVMAWTKEKNPEYFL